MQHAKVEPSRSTNNAYWKAVSHARMIGLKLPTFAQLANPHHMPKLLQDFASSANVGKPDAGNLFRLHWFNKHDSNFLADVPPHLELPSTLTGVKARIIIAFGNSFPMIRAHKVLAAYACLVTRLVTGRFDPGRNKAVWPSTGNYCRGGIAISRILNCRGVAVLPEQMSQERFDWLKQWTLQPDEDIVRTKGSESNVKEIYDACEEMEKDSDTVVLNQFSEFPNYLVHRIVTGPALGKIFESSARPSSRLSAFVAGVGSAGTLAAGDHLKKMYGTRIAATEPLECPTMLCNGYGEHNIQGIGDKHIPLIQNVMNMDFVIGVSDRASDALNVLFNAECGTQFLRSRFGVEENQVSQLSNIGLSGLANIEAAIKLSKHQELNENDVIICVATDGADLYTSEINRTIGKVFGGRCGMAECAEIVGQTLTGCEPAHVLELTSTERRRIFNLGYYTWVEQRGVALEFFDARKDQAFWESVAAEGTKWDRLIEQFNTEVAGAKQIMS